MTSDIYIESKVSIFLPPSNNRKLTKSKHQADAKKNFFMEKIRTARMSLVGIIVKEKSLKPFKKTITLDDSLGGLEL